jgi:hypothetical protein
MRALRDPEMVFFFHAPRCSNCLLQMEAHSLKQRYLWKCPACGQTDPTWPYVPEPLPKATLDMTWGDLRRIHREALRAGVAREGDLIGHGLPDDHSRPDSARVFAQ